MAPNKIVDYTVTPKYLSFLPPGSDMPADATFFANLKGVELKAENIGNGTKKALEDHCLVLSEKKPEGATRTWEVFNSVEKNENGVRNGTDLVLNHAASLGKTPSQFKALLVINGKLLSDPPNFRVATTSDEGQQDQIDKYAKMDGCITKNFVGSCWDKEDIGGGIYFFDSPEAIEKYTTTKTWEWIFTPMEGFWVDRKIEKYEVC